MTLPQSAVEVSLIPADESCNRRVGSCVRPTAVAETAP